MSIALIVLLLLLQLLLLIPIQPHATVELILPDPVTQGITIMAGNSCHINQRLLLIIQL